MKRIIIAIDGYSSCGKSSMAKYLADSIGYTYIDTGAMYRAVTLYACQSGFFRDGSLDVSNLKNAMNDIHISFRVNSDTGGTETYLNDRNVEREIRGMEVANHVSLIATLPFVRQALVEQQRRMGQRKGIVMDGRDIGTVVFPDAELKVFVTASAEIRAWRRWNELSAKGEDVKLDDVLENVRSRDYQDSTRENSPLCKAEDALYLDNTTMAIDEQNEWLLNHFHKKIAPARGYA